MMALRESPAESDVLCERCGYILNGLAPDAGGHCPECGGPTVDSLSPDARRPAPVELAWTPANFWRTTALVLFRKRRFFRETLTRTESAAVGRFGRWHRRIAGALFAVAGATHLAFMAETRQWTGPRWSLAGASAVVAAGLVLVPLSIGTVAGVTRLAVWMTTKESAWWGMRLPRRALRRAMDFHAANYLPVGLAAVALTGGYRVLYALGVITPVLGVPYLVALSLLVVASAVWLFESFVIAMRRIRFANF